MLLCVNLLLFDTRTEKLSGFLVVSVSKQRAAVPSRMLFKHYLKCRPVKVKQAHLYAKTEPTKPYT